MGGQLTLAQPQLRQVVEIPQLGARQAWAEAAVTHEAAGAAEQAEQQQQHDGTQVVLRGRLRQP
jgi:hypothetical protein